LIVPLKCERVYADGINVAPGYRVLELLGGEAHVVSA